MNCAGLRMIGTYLDPDVRNALCACMYLSASRRINFCCREYRNGTWRGAPIYDYKHARCITHRPEQERLAARGAVANNGPILSHAEDGNFPFLCGGPLAMDAVLSLPTPQPTPKRRGGRGSLLIITTLSPGSLRSRRQGLAGSSYRGTSTPSMYSAVLTSDLHVTSESPE